MDYLAAVQPVFLVLSSIVVNVPSISAVVALVIAVMLLMASAFVSGSEIAFFSLDTSEMEELDEEENPTDKRLSVLLSHPERLLATILIANNLVNVAIVMLLNFFFMQVLDFSNAPEWMEFLLLTVILSFLL